MEKEKRFLRWTVNGRRLTAFKVKKIVVFEKEGRDKKGKLIKERNAPCPH
ncbi:MAG: hypothetical protein ACI9XO_003254 [Paraglaciecola sp.]